MERTIKIYECEHCGFQAEAQFLRCPVCGKYPKVIDEMLEKRGHRKVKLIDPVKDEE